MKKTTKKLRLGASTVRVLTHDLGKVVAGALSPSAFTDYCGTAGCKSDSCSNCCGSLGAETC